MRHMFKAALIAATSINSASAFAQELVVTATRTPTPIDALAARIEVIDRADIEARGVVSLPEALGPAAVQSGGAGQQTSLFLRGANSKHALALFDGIRLNDASTPNAQYDFGLDTLGGLERVEVLRGPASAIYGSDALGGAVNLIPRRGGEAAFSPFGETALGEFDTRRALLGATGANGGSAYGLSGEWFATGGYDLVPERLATRTGDPDGAHISTVTATAAYDAGVVTLDVLARWRDSRTEFDTFSGGPFFDLRADDADLENEATQTVWRLGATFAPRDALSLRLAGGEVRNERAEIDGGRETGGAESTRQFADATAHYSRGGATVTAGVSYERNNIATSPLFALPLSAEEDQLGVFLIAHGPVTQTLSVTASVRSDDFENFGTQTTYAVGAVAQFGPLRLFASHGTAFKAPSLSERFETSFFNIGNPSLQPEQSRSSEIGVDWRIARALSAGASYYQTQIDDLIEYDFFSLRNVNIGEAQIDGAEAFIEAATERTSLRIAYAWTDAANGVTGQRLARRPEHTWRAELAFEATDRLGVIFSWTHVGERLDVTYDDDGTFSSSAGLVDGFHIGAIAATFDVSARLQTFARVDNVTDETYEQPAAFAGAPRAWTLGLRARY